ncbi:MAG: M48 family metalloprotease [Alphaproteobacteria bacterium]|nr:M48 family metalloprotease [Alphaproteobacteria bacterium]
MRRIFILTIIFCLFGFNAKAVSLISDEETESYLYDILKPIFNAADLPLRRDYIHIVKDDSLNAFVGDQNRMFVHTGTLIKAANSNEIEGVLAHETGHILGGHILRLKIKMQDLQKATLASMVAAAGAAAASGRGDAAIAVVLGAQSSAINAMSAYQMSEERAADETAVLLLGKNHKSVKGLKDFMTKIQNANRLQGIEEIPYFRTHPVTSERVGFFNDKLKKERGVSNDFAKDERLKRIRAKLFAYLAPLDKVIKQYPLTDTSIAGNVAHTVYYMRQRKQAEALKYADILIGKEPNNPYFLELKGQILFEGGRFAEAARIYQEALSFKPQSDLFKLNYAEAVLAGKPSAQDLKKLIALLEQAGRNGAYPSAYLYLGRVYADLGQMAEADYFAAEYNYALGEKEIAQKQLKKALKQNLRSDIKLRAKDLEAKLWQDKKKDSLF